MRPSRYQTPLARRLQGLSRTAWGRDGVVTMLGRHDAFVQAQDRLARYSDIDRPVLLQGESGVGKELFARSLHLLSDRRPRPFVAANCAVFQNEHLLVSELFGHAAGAFTGADSRRCGLFETAAGGTLFLDEVSELPPRAQAALLRALGEGEVRRLGDDQLRTVDVRIVAATNQDLGDRVRRGRFRADLYHRLGGLHLTIPPLRRRGADWRLLFDAYLDRLNREHDLAGSPDERSLTDRAAAVLAGYRWPGNVRELHAVADVGFCLAADGRIEPRHLRPRLHRSLSASAGDGVVCEPASELAASELPACGLAPSSIRCSDCNDRSPGGAVEKPRDLDRRYHALATGKADFWATIHKPYLDRDLNRKQVRTLIARGLRVTEGSYVRLLPLFGIDRDDYSRFMDFLRHHRLKPPASW